MSKNTILITGANSFYAGAIIKLLLSSHHGQVFIHATVRDVKKGEYLEKKWGKENLKYFVVADITEEEAFFEAVRGCNLVCHVASVGFFTLIR